MAVLDPDGKDRTTWNRYAHIMVKLLPPSTVPTFRLVQADWYELGVDPCDPRLAKLDIDRVAMPDGEAARGSWSCLDAMGRIDLASLQVFRIRRSATE